MSSFSQSNVSPLLAQYGNSIITGNNLANFRGTGNFNEPPKFEQTTDRGNAYENALNLYSKNNTVKPSKELEGTLNNIHFHPEIENTWEKNVNDLNYDEYQRWAINSTRKNDKYILPYFFSKINVRFIQKSVVDYVKKLRDFTIETKQDTDSLLIIMRNHYIRFLESKLWYDTDINGMVTPMKSKTCSFESLLGNLNKITIEEYVKQVLSGLNSTQHYMSDISTLPIPLSNPTNSSIKGHNVLANQGPFESSHDLNRAIKSYNTRNSFPSK